MLLKNKVALVTGGGSGIGRAVAMALAREGSQVLVTDMNTSAGNTTANLIEESGGIAKFLTLDVSKASDHIAAVAAAVQHFGNLNIACNNAGISTGRSGTYPLLADVEYNDWQDIINVNMNGVFYGMQAQINEMIKSNGGSIVNISSVMGQVAGRGLGPYVATKHGVVGLTKAAAIDYAQVGIRVNAVGPGYIDTPILELKDQKTLDHLKSLHPMGRLGTADEVAEMVVWLCSDRASFTTGAYFPVDGGYLAK